MNSKGTITFGLFAFLVVFGHLLLIDQGILYGELKRALIIDLILLFMALLGLLVLYTNNDNKSSFTFRFLGLTVFQFIGFLSIVAAMIYKQVPDAKYWVISALIIFFLFLFVQTLLLVRSMKTNP